MTDERCWQISWETGPDAGERWHAPSGRHVVGRAQQAEIRCHDPALEPFHLDIDLDGEIPVVRQLAGRLPVRVQSLGADAAWRAQVGHSVLAIRRVAVASASGACGERTIARTPRHLELWSPNAVRVQPDPAPPARPTGGVVPALAALVATAVVAVVVRQMMYVVVGAVGTVVAASTWIVGRLGHRRHVRDHRADLAAERERVTAELAQQRSGWADHLRRTVPTLAETIAMITSGRGLWQRRSADGDARVVSLGVGAVAWMPTIDGTPDHDARPLDRIITVDDLPVAFDVGPGTRLAISGPHAAAVANALVLQLAALTGPADWQLVVVTTTPDQWLWTRHLPHAHDAVGRHLMVDEAALLDMVRDGSLTGRHTLVITDQAAALSVRTSAIRRLETAHDSLAMVVVHQGAPPAVCRSAVITMSDGRARHVSDVGVDPEPVEMRSAGVTAAAAERWAHCLRDRRDPEDDRLHGMDIPATVGLSALLADTGIDVVDPASIAAAWARAGNDPVPSTPIGRASDGVVEIDLVRDGPHALLAGTTGAGKSELLRSLVIGLSCALGPQHLTFVLVDYKGGAAFDELGSLPHVVGTVTDLDHQLAERALRSLRAELTVRERLLRDHGASDLTALRAQPGSPVLPRILVVVDEFAALAAEQADFLHALVGIAQRGRSLGVHLLLATQRPSGVISDDIRANTNLRMALRLHDTSDAMDVVGDAAPASLPRGLPGRAVMRLGPDELVTFQTADTADIASIVAAVRSASDMTGNDRPRQVWCEPLADRIDHLEVARLADHPDATEHGGAAVGVIDLPDQQSQDVFRWAPSDGSVLVVGSSGSGVTSTLITLATTALMPTAALGPATPPAHELFVIDAGDDPSWDAVAAHPRCAGVVRLHERERLWRLLRRVAIQVANEVDASPGVTPMCTRLVIDGLGALRHELDAVERVAELELLDRIVASGNTVLLVGADRVAAVPPSLTSRCAVRVVMNLHDTQDAGVLGIPAAIVPPLIAGRAVIGGTGAAVQFVAPHAVRVTGSRRQRVVPIEMLPIEVGAAALTSPMQVPGSWRVPIGVGFVDLESRSLEIGDGEHVLIAGPARSGRSTALAQLCLAWLASSAPAQVTVIAGRRSPLPGWIGGHESVDIHVGVETALDDVEASITGGRRVMLAIDDAEQIDDTSGRLAAMIAARPAGLLVVAAGRPDALRQSYGHWTAAVRRSRLGLLSSAAQDVDGDLFGATLPRRVLLAPRPGLMHLIDGGSVDLVQLALPDLDLLQIDHTGRQVSDRVS